MTVLAVFAPKTRVNLNLTVFWGKANTWSWSSGVDISNDFWNVFLSPKIWTYIEILVIWIRAANVNVFIVQLLHAIDEKRKANFKGLFEVFGVCEKCEYRFYTESSESESRENLQLFWADIDK